MASKIPKFMLCDNPMLDHEHPGFILHARPPQLLLEIHHEAIGIDKLSVSGQYNGPRFGEVETIALVCVWHSPAPEEEIKKILARAWDWYMAYLKWEDDQPLPDE